MKIIKSLNGVWQWHCAGETTNHAGTVPGSVLADMLREGLVEDPFWRMNEYHVREKFAKDYVYTTAFTVTEEELLADNASLVFEGLDTIAEVRLNGTLLAKVNDMHRTFRFGVKDILCAGANTIEVYFYSSLRFIRQKDAHSDIFYASTGCIRGNAALRKAHYMFGWDWGPQLPDAGIFRPVFLEFSSVAVLSDLRIRQRHGNGVSLLIEAGTEQYGTGNPPLQLVAEIEAPDGEIFRQAAPAQKGKALHIKIPNPQLWWPNGWGEQPLYLVRVSLLCGETVLDNHHCRVGLRTCTVSTQPDEWGKEFAFVVNGQKIFAMGANYIPEDNIIARITPQKSKALVADCAKANFNMLRIWGGGYYPDDYLYDACDEYGILVWQDLMFACNVYALDAEGDFEQNIVAETKDNVRRLRHHACLALWCGNNEMEWGWGDEWQRIKGHHPRYKADYIKIFEFLLERTVQKYDGETFWWPSSPSSGGAFDKPNHPDFGDQHYWEVWHSNKPFTEYRKSHFRFCSEYGFQSFPHSKTIRSFTLPEDRNLFSEVMESHQKNPGANNKILGYIADYFLYPKDLDSVAYISQVLQLKAVQYGVEHWRRNRGRCMGSLYWQLNDCWPVASWASIDYYGRWKALHYGAKRFYATVTASACEKEELSSEITYYVHNDSRAAHHCVLEVSLLDVAFNEYYHKSQQVTVSPLCVLPAIEVDFSPYLQKEAAPKQMFARYRLWENDSLLCEGTTLFSKPKHMALPQVEYRHTWQEKADCFELYLTASAFSYYTEVYFTECDPVLSDNFFDITSAQGVCLRVDKQNLPANAGVAMLDSQLRIRSVKDSFITE